MTDASAGTVDVPSALSRMDCCCCCRCCRCCCLGVFLSVGQRIDFSIGWYFQRWSADCRCAHFDNEALKTKIDWCFAGCPSNWVNITFSTENQAFVAEKVLAQSGAFQWIRFRFGVKIAVAFEKYNFSRPPAGTERIRASHGIKTRFARANSWQWFDYFGKSHTDWIGACCTGNAFYVYFFVCSKEMVCRVEFTTHVDCHGVSCDSWWQRAWGEILMRKPRRYWGIWMKKIRFLCFDLISSRQNKHKSWKLSYRMTCYHRMDHGGRNLWLFSKPIQAIQRRVWHGSNRKDLNTRHP